MAAVRLLGHQIEMPPAPARGDARTAPAPLRGLGLAAFVFLVWLLAACAPAMPGVPAGTPEPDPLNGTRWQLVAVVVGGQPLDVPAQPTLFAGFSEGVIYFYGGCSNIMGHYQTPPDPIRTVVASSTLEDCSASMPEVMALEAAAYEALQSLGTYTIDGTHLTLHRSETTVVLRRADEPPTPATTPGPTATLATVSPTAPRAAEADATATTTAAAEPTRVPTVAMPTPDAAFAAALAEHLHAAYARRASAEELGLAADAFAEQYYGAAPRYTFVSEGAAPVLILATVVSAENDWQYVPYFCWPDADSVRCQGWPPESTLWFYLMYEPTRVRIVPAGDTLEMGLISGPLGNSGEYSYALLRLHGSACTVVWTSAAEEGYSRWLTDFGGEVRFRSDGLDSLQLRGRLPNDVPAARFFYEWRFYVLQEYVSVWQRRGDSYERVQGQTVESPMKALSEFMSALTQDDVETASRRTSRPAVLNEAAAIGLNRLLPQRWGAVRDPRDDSALLLQDVRGPLTTGPAYRVTLQKRDGRWLVDGVEYLLTPTPTPRPPLPTATATPTAPPPATALTPVAALAVNAPSGGIGDDAAHPADWQPGTLVLSYCSGTEMRAVTPPIYRPRVMATVPRGTAVGLRWSPDGGAALVLANEEFATGLIGDTIRVLVPRGAGRDWIDVPSSPLYSGKSLGQWLDASTATFRMWLGGGVQALYAVDAQTGHRRVVLDTQQHAERAAIGGRYYPSPDGRYVAVEDCCSAHIFVAAIDSPDARHWVTDPTRSPYQAFQAWLSPNEFAYVEGDAIGLGGITLSRCDDSTALWAYDVEAGRARRILNRVCVAVPSADGSTLALVRPGTLSEDEPTPCPTMALPDDRVADTRPTDCRGGPTRSAPTLALMDTATGHLLELGPVGSRVIGAATVGDPADDGPLGRPRWSPDGTRLAVWGERGDVWLVTPATARWQQVTALSGASELLWSPDGTHLAVRIGGLVYLYRVPAG